MWRAVLLIVPGRDDRAFYKAFIMRAFEGRPNAGVEDLDGRAHESERRKIIQRIFPAPESGGPQFLRRSALLKLQVGGSVTHVLITPAETGVTDKAAQILAYLSGLERAGAVDTVVAAEDMEEVSAEDRLARLRDSIASRAAPNRVDLGNSVSSGRYYRLYRLSKPAGVRLLLIAQGIEELSQISRHAVEDFAIYTALNELHDTASPLKQCVNALDVLKDSRVHKKLALLIAVSRCCVSTEEFFLRTLSRDHVNSLREAHDGLNKLMTLLA